VFSVQHNEHNMSAINFSLPAPTNGLVIDHRNPPTTHIFNDVPIDGTIHKVVYICGDQMVYQPTPLPSQKNDNDIFYLSSDEDGLEGLDLLPPISSPKKKKGAKAQFQARKDARKLKKEAAVKLIQAVFVGIRTREEAKHAQEKYAAELKKERAARKAQRKSPAGKAQKAAQKMADEYNKVQAEAAQARKTLEQYTFNLLKLLGSILKASSTASIEGMQFLVMFRLGSSMAIFFTLDSLYLQLSPALFQILSWISIYLGLHIYGIVKTLSLL